MLFLNVTSALQFMKSLLLISLGIGFCEPAGGLGAGGVFLAVCGQAISEKYGAAEAFYHGRRA